MLPITTAEGVAEQVRRRAGMQELLKIRHRLQKDQTAKAIQELAAHC